MIASSPDSDQDYTADCGLNPDADQDYLNQDQDTDSDPAERMASSRR